MDKVRILDRLISIVSVFMIDKQLVHVYREEFWINCRPKLH